LVEFWLFVFFLSLVAYVTLVNFDSFLCLIACVSLVGFCSFVFYLPSVATMAKTMMKMSVTSGKIRFEASLIRVAYIQQIQV
jgi:hypothetical protein